MAPTLDVSGKDYERARKILELAGIDYSIPKSESNSSDFIYIPSLDLEVAKERTLFDTNFYDAQKTLHSNNQKMLTISEFKEFLKYTKANHQDLYDEITQVRSPWRAEWLDADFKVQEKDLVVNYHVFEGGKIIQKSEVLDKNTLMVDKIPGISLESWLQNSTKQGLPKKVADSGDLYYWAPDKDDNSVARFDTGPGRAVLVGLSWSATGIRCSVIPFSGYEQRSCESNVLPTSMLNKVFWVREARQKF